jgi:hypothetical protein
VQFGVVAMLTEAISSSVVTQFDPILFIIPSIMIAAYPAPRALISASREGAMSKLLLLLSILAAALLLPEAWRLVHWQLAGIGGEHATENHWILTANLELLLIMGGRRRHDDVDTWHLRQCGN